MKRTLTALALALALAAIPALAHAEWALASCRTDGDRQCFLDQGPGNRPMTYDNKAECERFVQSLPPNFGAGYYTIKCAVHSEWTVQ